MLTRRPIPAVVAAVAGVLTIGGAAAAQTALDERQQHVATITTGEIEKLTGPAARNCGIYPLTGGIDSPSPVGRDDIATALRCIQGARRRGQAAWVIWQVTGVDAIVFDGLAASAASAVHTVHGLGSDAEITLRPCLTPRVLKDASLDCANVAHPLSAGDVDDAMMHLARDVRRTAGRELADLIPGDAAAPRRDDVSGTASPERNGPSSASPSARDGAAPLPGAIVARAVAEAQRAVHADGEPQWPRCPHHFDHALTYADGWWFCERDRAFIAALGRIATKVPRVTRRR